MIDQNDVRSVAPAQLAEVRSLAHRAAQHVTRAARANLTAVPDDSHSNLAWVEDRGALVSQALTTSQGAVRIALSISEFELIVLRGGGEEARCRLEGMQDQDVGVWLDGQLVADGLQPASPVSLPYGLPADVAQIDAYALDGLGDRISALAAWYSLAAGTFSAFAAGCRDITPGPSPVRCWPHHFDIATYLSLEEGDFETAKGIGIGLSPGDESYGEPYVYVNPWPHMDAGALPPAPAPGHWHVEGFVGAIATTTEILTLSDIPGGLSQFVEEAVSIGRTSLGA